MNSHRPLRVLDVAKFEEIQRLNTTTASMMIAKAFRQKGCSTANGSIVLLSSVYGLVGQNGFAAYASSKAALLAFTAASL